MGVNGETKNEREDVFAELKKPFPVDKVHWRLGWTNQKQVAKETGNQYAKATKGQPLAYVDARDVMDRLDEIVGGENWQCNYSHSSNPAICNVGIFVDGEWIWKADGAGDTKVEGEKGSLSDAFKRATVRFGPARDLYGVRAPKVELHNGKMTNATIKMLDKYLPQPIENIGEGMSKGDRPDAKEMDATTRRKLEDIYNRMNQALQAAATPEDCHAIMSDNENDVLRLPLAGQKRLETTSQRFD